ncbi:MAG: helix-turn-helix domain-containing protein [Burkholderiales bacterium]
MSKLSTGTVNLEIGRRLAALRERSRLVQTEFAEGMGVSPRAYQNYERGERELPAAVLTALYETYGADPLWVLTGLTSDLPTVTAKDLDILEDVVIALEGRLKKARRSIGPEKKARLIKLMFLYFRDKPGVDEAHVLDMLALTA